jgi:DNA-binding NarL/FixJ family response regulator
MTRPVPRLVALTPAEHRVLRAFLHDGADNPTLARRCDVSTETIRSHIRRILAATATRSKAELAVAALTGRLAFRTHPHARTLTERKAAA